ncbi:MAG: hypothetical protein CVU42_05005 [Chloroflexi bacterium HGW-Chloroflexi-4]|jgi:hypothetical protein|nr:MAG: hypothetical protein CVU42_05005 [Chloroflexi bacterium HGW-Chloroflexi-4]
MNTELIPLEYANHLIYELEKAFWDERGKGAKFRLTKVGKEFFDTNCLPKIKSNEINDIIQTIEQVLVEKKIIGKINFSNEDRLFRLTIEGCIHESVEKQLAAKAVEPLACFPANLIILAIEKKLDRPVELAEIKINNGACQLLLVLFEKRPSVG